METPRVAGNGTAAAYSRCEPHAVITAETQREAENGRAVAQVRTIGGTLGGTIGGTVGGTIGGTIGGTVGGTQSVH